MKRIGLFGGTFDPVHNAHVALARSARDDLALDHVRWVPAGQPWQKQRPLTPAVHREAMVRLAIEGEPRFVLDRIELERAGPSYTLQTVQELQAREPGSEWFLVIGQDQYARIDSWRDAAQWRSDVTFAVAARDGQPPRPPSGWSASNHRHVVLPLPEHPVSATRIRQMIAAGQAVDALVGPAVARYIAQHHLYRP